MSLSGLKVLEKHGTNVIRSTAFDKYLSRDPRDISSFYYFVCKQGKVNNSSTQASWPLDERYCRTMLKLQCSNWRKLNDLKAENMSWIEFMENLLKTEQCPNFIKADKEKSKKPLSHFDKEEDCEQAIADDTDQQE